MQPTLCTAQGMKSANYLTELQKSAPFTQEARFPTSEWSCMYSVMAKQQNDKWEGQKNQSTEHSG